jgi:hypothetical protein
MYIYSTYYKTVKQTFSYHFGLMMKTYGSGTLTATGVVKFHFTICYVCGTGPTQQNCSVKCLVLAS